MLKYHRLPPGMLSVFSLQGHLPFFSSSVVRNIPVHKLWTCDSSHFAGKKMLLMRNAPPRAHWAAFKNKSAQALLSSMLPFCINTSAFVAPGGICLLCWRSQPLQRNNSKTRPSASAVKLMRQGWPWGSRLQSELAMLTDPDKPQSWVIRSRGEC